MPAEIAQQRQPAILRNSMQARATKWGKESRNVSRALTDLQLLLCGLPLAPVDSTQVVQKLKPRWRWPFGMHHGSGCGQMSYVVHVLLPQQLHTPPSDSVASQQV